MKKIPSRQFQKDFTQLSSALKPGQTVQVTEQGKPVGQFTKLGRRRVKMPDFMKELEKLPYSAAEGDAMLKKFNDALS